MALHKIGELSDYTRYVKEMPKEAEELYRDVLITVTNFFREAEAFEVLKKEVFGTLFAASGPQSRSSKLGKKRIPLRWH